VCPQPRNDGCRGKRWQRHSNMHKMHIASSSNGTTERRRATLASTA
jgi:hypothetical protein